MNPRFSVVAAALMIMGIFMLVGFLPIGIALIVIALIIQSNRKAQYLNNDSARRSKAQGKSEEQMASTMRSMRS